MSHEPFTDAELSAYLEEMLPVERMAAVEGALRQSAPLRRRLAGLARGRDHGVHSVGDIWRRRRTSCPARNQLGGYLLGTLEADQADYVQFHLYTVGCRYCLANLRDLEEASRPVPETQVRRRKYFETSAGYLRPSMG